jgi:hypothetical protein
MTPAEYDAHVRAWRKKERRTQERFALLGVISNNAMGGKLRMDDLMPEESDE